MFRVTYDVGRNQDRYDSKTSSDFAIKYYELLLDVDNVTTEIVKFRLTK